MEITLLGELRVVSDGQELALPASRKARALLAFLVATGRPHRRERLCELFWDIPDDPKAALRWALSKLRKVVDHPQRVCIHADRERVSFDAREVSVDLSRIHTRLRDKSDHPALVELEKMAEQLQAVLLDGLDEAGDEGFLSWLVAEREDAHLARVDVLSRLVRHPEVSSVAQRKWLRQWQEVDPEGAESFQKQQSEEDASNSFDDRSGLRKGASFLSPLPDADKRPFSERTRTQATGTQKHALRAQRIGFCEAPGNTKIAYASVGSGPPILKAANWLTHLEFDWSSPIWGKSFAEIANRRTFIRYDERGCGLSDWDVDELSFDAFVEDLEAVADNLGLDKFPLVGISQGCAVSIEYAVRHPERVSGLILIGGYAAGWRHLATPEEQARREAVLTLTELGWGTDNPAYRHIFSKTFMPEADAATLDWFDEFQRQTTSPRNAARFQDAFGYIDVRDRLSEVRAPTIVLHSKYDQRIPLEQGRDVASGIPGAYFVPLESRNHILVENEPAWQDCLETINRFLEEQGI